MKKNEKYMDLLERLAKYKQFASERVEKTHIGIFKKLSELARLDILKMTTISGTGHLGGSFSTIDVYLLLWLCANTGREKIKAPDRDIIIISIGHTLV